MEVEEAEAEAEVRPRKPVRSSLTSTDTSGDPSRQGSLRQLSPGPLHSSLSCQSLCEALGQDVADDTFHAEVAQKTSAFMVGRQEAEMEVVMDRVIARQGSKDKALLFVLSQIPTEVKVQEMVNTLLHRGANPSFCDGQWHTPLHHATRRGFKGVVSKLLENDALPTARDRQRQMPLHIAIAHNMDDLAALILAFMPNSAVRPLFTCHDDNMAELSLHQLIQQDMQQTVLAVLDCMIDTIGQSGHVKVYYHVLDADANGRPPSHPDFNPASRSCLHLISKGGYKNIVYHDVVRLLIRRKWKQFARIRFQLNSFLFLLTQIALCFCAVSATMTSDPTEYSGGLQYVRAALEAWSVVAVFITFLLELNQMRKQVQGREVPDTCHFSGTEHRVDYFTDQFNWIDLLSSSLLLSVVALRWTHSGQQWPVFSVGFLLWTLRIFKYAAVFRQTGAYSQILWRIVSRDFPQFLVVFSVILLAFSGAFVLALKGEDSFNVHQETSTFWYILFTGVRILIEGEPVVDYTGPEGYKPLSCILMVVFLFTCCVVLLNILIAQLSDTYQNVQRDAQRGLELNRAWIVARVELNSLFIGKGYRQSRYLEAEEMRSPLEVLEKWETPPLNEMNKHVRDIWDSLESHKLNLLTIKNRISRHEYTLAKIQDQLDIILKLMGQQSSSANTPEVSGRTADMTSFAEEHRPDSTTDRGDSPHFE